MFVSPGIAVMKREVLTGLRDIRPAVFLALFLAILILGLLLLLEVVYAPEIRQNGAISAQLVARLFVDFSKSLYLSSLLLVPPLAAIAICNERQQDSFDLLRMTYISPLALASAKLANVLGIFFLTVVATLPFVGVTFFLIGIDWIQFVLTLLLILSAAATLSVLGLWCSAQFHRTLPAIVFTYVLGYAVHGGLLRAVILLTELLSPDSDFSYTLKEIPAPILIALHPFVGLDLIGEGGLGWETAGSIVAFNGTVSLFVLLLVIRALRHPVKTARGETARPITCRQTLASRRRTFPFHLIDPRRENPPIPDGRNPIRIRDARLAQVSHGAGLARLCYGFAVFSFLVSLMCMDLYGEYNLLAQMAGWTILYVTGFILLLTPSLVATTIAREWEWQNVESLRATLLTSSEIFWGKFENALGTASVACVGTIIGTFPLYIFGRDSWEVWRASAMAIIWMYVCMLYGIAVSLWAASRSRTTIAALLSAYGACAFCLVLVVPTALILSKVSLARVFAPAGAPFFYYFFSPLTAFHALVERKLLLNTAFVNLYWLLNCTIFAALSGLLLRLAYRRFHTMYHQS